MLQKIYLLLLFTLVISPIKIIGQGLPPVQQLMTQSELKETGLSKLSAAELRKFNEWLERYTLTVFEVANSQSRTSNNDVIESQIEGEFKGWEGDTIFKLTNGQIWQQTLYAYHYHYAYRPKVTIIKTDAGYRMKVDGISQTIYVKRVR